MHTRHHAIGLRCLSTILAFSLAVLCRDSLAQGDTPRSAASATADAGGGTCDGCLDEAAAPGPVNGDDFGNDGFIGGDFITGIAAANPRALEHVAAPSATEFSLAMLAIGAVVFFIRRWFAVPV